jgi:hypothetical protein
MWLAFFFIPKLNSFNLLTNIRIQLRVCLRIAGIGVFVS